MEDNGVERDVVSPVDVSLEPVIGHRVSHHRTIVNSTVLNPQIPLSSNWRSLRASFTCWPCAADALVDTVLFVLFENPDQDFAIRVVGELPIAVLFAFVVASGALYWL